MKDNKRDNKIGILICACFIINLLLMGLGITQTECYHYYGICLLGSIINIIILTIIFGLERDSTKEK